MFRPADARGRGIAEITQEASLGPGSSSSHFDSKEQLFQTTADEVLEGWGQMVDRASAGITDPAERQAVGLRTSGGLLRSLGGRSTWDTSVSSREATGHRTGRRHTLLPLLHGPGQRSPAFELSPAA